MNYTEREGESVLKTLRALVPHRQTTFTEALRIAEQQAHRLLRNVTNDGPGPIPSDLVLDLPRIAVRYDATMPTSGCSFWDAERKTWILQINAAEPRTRQRFTLFHEYKHIIDHGRTHHLYGSGPEADMHAEQAADYFAGCVLMSRPLLKRAWCQGVQTVERLAARFNVSVTAVRVRLAQIGLVDQPARCTALQHAKPVNHPPRARYHRQLHSDFEGQPA